MTAPLLAVDNLVVATDGPRGEVVLVNGFDLSVAAGERVALVGESGSGKTLVARSVMGLTGPLRVSGSVRFAGDELLGLAERAMQDLRGRRIGMVFQDPLGALNPLMTIGAQIAEPLRIAGVAKKPAMVRAADLLGELGVVDATARLSAYPHEFSGGMRQRVALAMALIGDPALIIADEPTTALDVRVQEQVLDLLDRVAAERGLAVLIITHDLGVVAGFAERVAVMYAGSKVHEDGVERLFRAPAHPYTAALLDTVPRMDLVGQHLLPIPGSPPHPTQRPSGCAFHPRCRSSVSQCASTAPGVTQLAAGGMVRCHRPLSPVAEERP